MAEVSTSVTMTVTQANPLRVIADGADTDSVAAKVGAVPYLVGDRVQATLRTPLPPLVGGQVLPGTALPPEEDPPVTWPTAFEIGSQSFPITQTGWPYLLVFNNALGLYLQSPAGNTSGELTYPVQMAAGDWWVLVNHVKGPNLGRLRVSIDGTDGPTIDCYQASTYAITTSLVFLGQTFADPAERTVTIRKMGTKNASASDYYALVYGVSGVIL